MKKYIRLICVLLSVAAFTACEDEDRGLVVSQDTSYQLDPDYVYVDIPKEFQCALHRVLGQHYSDIFADIGKGTTTEGFHNHHR